MEDLEKDINDAYKKLLKQIEDAQERIFTEALRTTVIPPVKGEITKGKIKWRGVRIAHQMKGFKTYTWLEQRGVQVSPKIEISFNPQNLNN